MTISIYTVSHWSGSGRRHGVSAHLGVRLKEWGAQRAGAAIASRVLVAWGAERERSASMHAMRLQNGNPCM
eukprot:6207561-Pleurochrysis_carterae.AAC.3